MGTGRTAGGECTGQGKKKRTGCTGNGTEGQGAALARRHSRWAGGRGGGPRHRREVAARTAARPAARRTPAHRRRGALAAARSRGGEQPRPAARGRHQWGYAAPHAPMRLRRRRRPPSRNTRRSIRGGPGRTASVLRRGEGGRRVTPPLPPHHRPNTNGAAPAAAAGTFHTASAPARGERWTGHTNGDALVAAGLAAWLAGKTSLPASIGTGDETRNPMDAQASLEGAGGGGALRTCRRGRCPVARTQSAGQAGVSGGPRATRWTPPPAVSRRAPTYTSAEGGAVSGGAPLERHNPGTGDRRPYK